MYECGRCGKVLENVADSIRCPYCGYRIIYKTRPIVAKKVKAE